MSDAELTFVDEDPAPPQWTQVDNGFLNAPGLSWKATALLVYLKGRPPGWKVRPSQLAKVKTDGKDSVMSGLRELEKAGYVHRERSRDAAGRITGVICRFSWHPRWSQPQTGFPSVENPYVENPPLVSTEVQEALSTANTQSDLSEADGRDSEALIVTEALAEHVRQRPGAPKRIDLDAWYVHIDRMLRLDGVDVVDLLLFIEWLYTDPDSDRASFWRRNVRSAAKLREQYGRIVDEREHELRQAAKRAQWQQERAERELRTTTTRAEDSQHPQVRQVEKRLPAWFWSMYSDPEMRDEAVSSAMAYGFTWEEACAVGGRDPETLRATA